MEPSTIDFLLTRRSPPIAALSEPGPNESELRSILQAATSVPDHGALRPWRFIIYEGENRHAAGEALAERFERLSGPLTPGQRDKERERFSRAPLVVGVVCSPVGSEKVPEWEMMLSAGAAAMNILHAATALGFGANWITNWYSDDAEARRLLGLDAHERAVGFVHIGRYAGRAAERPPIDLDALVSRYDGPIRSPSAHDTHKD